MIVYIRRMRDDINKYYRYRIIDVYTGLMENGNCAIFGNMGNYTNGEIVKCQESFITFLYFLYLLNYSYM